MEFGFIIEKIQEIFNLNFDIWLQNFIGIFKKSWYFNVDGLNFFWVIGNDGVIFLLVGSCDLSICLEEKSVVNGKVVYMVILGSVLLVGVVVGNLFIGDYKMNV